MDKENTLGYTYIKVEFTNGTGCIIPYGKVVHSSTNDITVEEIGGETHMFMKANVTHFFIGTPDES